MQKKTQNRRYLIQTLKQQKTFEQNTREVTKAAALDSTERFNASLSSARGSGSNNTNTNGITSSTTTASTSVA